MGDLFSDTMIGLLQAVNIEKALKQNEIYMFFKGKEIWNAKMSENLQIKITSVPCKPKTAEKIIDKHRDQK